MQKIRQFQAIGFVWHEHDVTAHQTIGLNDDVAPLGQHAIEPDADLGLTQWRQALRGAFGFKIAVHGNQFFPIAGLQVSSDIARSLPVLYRFPQCCCQHQNANPGFLIKDRVVVVAWNAFAIRTAAMALP